MWYKIVEMHDSNLDAPHFRTLFHGNNGSRKLETDKWLEAEQKVVHDGSNGTPYTSGWHVIPTREEAEQYKAQFKSDRKGTLSIVRVWTIDVQKKLHSRSPVYLARWIFLGVWPNEP